MKFICLLLLGLSITTAVQAQNNQHTYSIKGDIRGLADGDTVKLIKPSGQGFKTRSTATVHKGRFHLTGDLPLEGELLFLMIDTSYSIYSAPVFMVSSPITMTAEVRKWPSSVVIKGSRPVDDHLALMKIIQPYYKEINSQQQKAINVLLQIDSIKRGTLAGDTLSLIGQVSSHRELEKSATENYFKYWQAFLDQYPHAVYTPFSIIKLGSHLKAEGMEAAYNKLDKNVQNSFYGVELKNEIANQKMLTRIRVGEIAPDFDSFTPDGRKISFKEIYSQHKLTLVDFWGSWCHPCREQIPTLKKVYEAFQDKGFNVLGVSLEYNKAAWVKALQEENMPWIQVSEIKGRDEQAAEKYAINGVPAYLLVDRKGKIIALDLPGSIIPSDDGGLRGDKLYSYIAGLLGEQKQVDAASASAPTVHSPDNNARK